MDMRPLTGTEIENIVNCLAWTDGTLDETMMIQFGVDMENLDRVMNHGGYEWDYSAEVWASKRPVWDEWDGTLPSV